MSISEYSALDWAVSAFLLTIAAVLLRAAYVIYRDRQKP